MADRQRTIAREVSLSGIGLHSGADTSVVFKPAPAGTGVRFIRTDLKSRPSVDVDVDAAVPGEDFSRRTTIGGSGACVGTVEHVLAALRGLGIDNAIVEIDAAEPPEPDGSCAPYVEVLKRAGAVEQDEERRYLVLTEPVEFIEGGIELRAVPYDGLRISFSISYDHPLIGTQDISLEISEDVFEKEIAPARTFSLLKDVERLKQRGLIRGGSLQNSIVVGDDEILNEGSLRFEDEFVRHKVLDLLGDLCLLGRPLKMHVSSVRSGHSTNLKFVKMLHRSLMKADKGLALGRQVSEVPTSLTIDQIQKIMPHRYPFLLVDRILSLEP
jgi:UDP-3-O-[3-hydroxymyristoyl] N-acetylglucosamine deacetylase/3-hydroxyacyl-[acyl-carrier-protein] dehydratase